MTETLAKWSVEDYHNMIAAGILNDGHVELLAGDIIEMSPEGVAHFYQGITGDNYQTKQTLTEGFISPLAFPNVEISIEQLLQGQL